jgi:DNA-binding NtrC family response regulator
MVETLMPSRRPVERTPERPPIRLFELSASDRAGIERLVGHTLAAVEREFILQTLRHTQGNRTRSARLLAISVRSLRDKIRSYRDEGESVPESASSALKYTAGRKTAGFRH